MTDILNGPPGTVCVVVVGGAKETQMSIPGTNKLFLKNRKGFVRLALKTGYIILIIISIDQIPADILKNITLRCKQSLLIYYMMKENFPKILKLLHLGSNSQKGYITNMQRILYSAAPSKYCSES